MIRAATLALSLALLTGCFRLTDPAYAFRGLRAPEQSSPERSLVFGTVEITGSMSAVDTIILRRVSPVGDEGAFPSASERKIYRAFRARQMKDGHFLIEVSPGTYEVEALQGGIWGQDAAFLSTEDARRATRFVVTRPDIYDVGVLRLDAGAFQLRAKLGFAGRGGPERIEVLRGAVAGTAWAKMLP